MALTTKDKKEMAQSLFLNTDKNQKEIAERVGVSANTLSTWATEGNWQTLKGAKTATKREVIADLYQQLALIKDSCTDAQGKRRPMDSKEAQAIRMISKSIAELDKKMSLDTYTTILEELVLWMYNEDAPTAKLLMGKIDAFFQAKVSELSKG